MARGVSILARMDVTAGIGGGGIDGGLLESLEEFNSFLLLNDKF